MSRDELPSIKPIIKRHNRKEVVRGLLAALVGIILAGGLMYVLFTYIPQPESDFDIVRRQCQESCPTYGATFVKIAPIPRTDDFECWCRKGNEPMRVW